MNAKATIGLVTVEAGDGPSVKIAVGGTSTHLSLVQARHLAQVLRQFEPEDARESERTTPVGGSNNPFATIDFGAVLRDVSGLLRRWTKES